MSQQSDNILYEQSRNVLNSTLGQVRMSLQMSQKERDRLKLLPRVVSDELIAASPQKFLLYIKDQGIVKKGLSAGLPGFADESPLIPSDPEGSSGPWWNRVVDHRGVPLTSLFYGLEVAVIRLDWSVEKPGSGKFLIRAFSASSQTQVGARH